MSFKSPMQFLSLQFILGLIGLLQFGLKGTSQDEVPMERERWCEQGRGKGGKEKPGKSDHLKALPS